MRRSWFTIIQDEAYNVSHLWHGHRIFFIGYLFSGIAFDTEVARCDKHRCPTTAGVFSQNAGGGQNMPPPLLSDSQTSGQGEVALESFKQVSFKEILIISIKMPQIRSSSAQRSKFSLIFALRIGYQGRTGNSSEPDSNELFPREWQITHAGEGLVLRKGQG